MEGIWGVLGVIILNTVAEAGYPAGCRGMVRHTGGEEQSWWGEDKDESEPAGRED